MKKAILFDAYGTLFDVYSIAALLERFFPSHGKNAAILWRDKQIEYTRLVTTCNDGAHYQPFDALTLAALRFVCAKLRLPLSIDQENALVAQYLELDAFVDAKKTLATLKERGVQTGILSNGTQKMLQSACTYAGLNEYLDCQLSIDDLHPPQYKTAPRAYAMGAEFFQLPAQDIIFVSSNSWDVLGANWFGYQTVWVNRTASPFEAIGPAPTYTIEKLIDLLDLEI